MRRITWIFGAMCSLSAGCALTPLADNPMMFRPVVTETENPVLVSPGQSSPAAYSLVFERVYDVVREYFVVDYANGYDGRIIAKPTIAPGADQVWKPGSPNVYERLYATFQTLRYRCSVQIRSAEQGGYLVSVVVYRELRDDPLPSSQLSPSVFRDAATVDRTFTVVDPVIAADDARWIPKGREPAIEHAILRKIQESQFGQYR